MLDADKHQELLARLSGDEDSSGETEAPEVQAEEAESVPHDEPEVESEPVVEASEDSEEEDHPHNVPYNRFKDVIEQRNELRDAQKQYEAQMEELRAQMDRLSSGSPPPAEEVDSYDSYEDSDGIDWMKWQKNVESRFEEYESQIARESLERDMAMVQERFPEVPQNAVLQAIALDGNTDAMDFAQEYSQFIQEVQEAGIARFRKEQGPSKAEAKPRAKSRSSSNSTGDSGAVSKPMTLEDTHAAVVRALKGQ